MMEIARDIAAHLSMPELQLHSLAASAPWRYKVFTIPKRSSSQLRVIAQPSRELKAIQRVLVLKLLSKLPVHDCAHGYVKGRGILTNAQAHSGSRFLLKLDLKDFFPSIRPVDLESHVRRHLPGVVTDAELKFVSRLLFWAPKGQHALRLCIGAPSSPVISNTVVYEMDERIACYCADIGVVYTRYADDMTFSTATVDSMSGIEGFVSQVLKGLEYPRLELNRRKVINSSMARKRVVTGLILTNQGHVSLGRERKRLIRSLAHRASLGQLDDEAVLKLDGLLAFAHSIEPDFVARTRSKFRLFDL